MRYTLLLSVLLSTISAEAQAPSSSLLGLYKWNSVVLMQPADQNGSPNKTNNENDPKIPSEVGQQFRVVDVNKGTALIIILNYTKTKTDNSNGIAITTVTLRDNFYKYNFFGDANNYAGLSNEQKRNQNYGKYQAYFTIDATVLSDIHLVIKDDKIGGALSLGVLNFPFKYRPQTGHGDFSGAFNFGAAIGYKFPHQSWRPFTYSVVSGYSISNTVLDSSNTVRNQGSLASSNNYSSFSFSLGFLIEYQKVQAGFFLGWDRLSNLNQREFGWTYQGRPWLSVGFGVAVFSTQSEKPNNNQTTQK